MKVEHLEGITFGSVVTGVDLEALDDAEWNELYELWIERALLIFPGAHLSPEGQDEFAKRFGDLEFPRAAISNIGKDGNVHYRDDDEVVKSLRGNEGWHHDSTYMPVQAKGAVFTAEIVPQEGGATGFADMRHAYDALDDATKARIEGLRCHHSLYHSQAKVGHQAAPVKDSSVNSDDSSGKTYGGYGFHEVPVSVRPLGKVHPETGRPNLLVGRHAYDIIGMAPEESEKLLQELVDFACQPPRIYHHDWEPGDVVIWDNRRLMHQATPWPFTQARRMWHSRIAGNPESEAALAA